MEVKRFEKCPVCQGRGGMEKGTIPTITIRKPSADLVHEPADGIIHWEPCTKCKGTGTVVTWVWVGL